MSEASKVHPLRRKKHRRGRRKRKPDVVAEPLALAPSPQVVQNLRSRLALMSKNRSV